MDEALIKPYSKAKDKALKLASKNNKIYVVRRDFKTGEFFVCLQADQEGRTRGSLEFLTTLEKV